MAEPEVATKAPESDAAEASTAPESIVPGDTPTQTGASMGGLGEHCVKDRPTRQYFQNLLAKNSPNKTACADLQQLLESDQVGK